MGDHQIHGFLGGEAVEKKFISIEKQVSEVRVKITSGNLKVMRSPEGSFKLFFEEIEPDVRIDGNALIIDAKKIESGIFGLLGFSSSSSEQLELHIPVDLASIFVNSVSADVQVSSVNAEKCMFRTVSGEIILENCRSRNVEVKSVSGDVVLSAIDVERLVISNASGDVIVNKLECREHDWLLNTVSGDVELNVVGLPNMKLILKSASGELTSNVGYSRHGNEYVFGDGRMRIIVSTVSGDVRVKVMSKRERVEEIERRILRLVAEGKLSYEEAKRMLEELS